MKKAIKELWSGDISPYMKLGEDCPEMNECHQTVIKNLDELYEATQKNGRTYDKCYDSISEYALLCAEIAFRDGFSLGVKLTAEAFCNKTPTE